MINSDALIVSENFKFLDERISALKSQCMKKLQQQGFTDAEIELGPFLHLRYEGTDCALMCSADSGANGLPVHGDFKIKFLNR